MALFKSFNIPQWLLTRLQSLNYVKTTGIQELVIPQALKGKSLVVRSETGSGKTHCFLVPMISNIDTKLDELQGLIIAPTKELANQMAGIMDNEKLQEAMKDKLKKKKEKKKLIKSISNK